MILHLLGDFAVQVAGRPAPPVRYRKSHWLLALLALHRGRELDRAWLSGLLWPDSSGPQALYNLRRSLAELRTVLGPEGARLGASTPHTLTLDLAGAQVDVLAFDAAITRSDEASLGSAVDLYRGPLLQGCYEEWISPERLAREEAYLQALERLAGYAAARGDPTAAVRWLRQAVARDPLRETAQQELLQALVASGDTIGALLAYRALRLRLRQELRLEPSPETKALYHQLRAQAGGRSGSRVSALQTDPSDPADRSGRPDASRRLPGAPHASPRPAAPRRLPRPLSRFVGRETALPAVEACLESARLVTLTGPGGVGKTRLAIQVADAVADDHPDGVWFVDLARLSDPGLVPQAVAAALRVQEQAGRPLTEALADSLRCQELLLVLDNCEHLLPACAELAEALLSAGPGVRILATSRQSLGLTGEVAWLLHGMAVPPAGWGVGRSVLGDPTDPSPQSRTLTTEPLCALLQYDAVRLFVERAREATAAFVLTERSAGHVAQICRQLDGLPLAIELAAARLKALAVHEIAARLDDRFSFLTGGSRTALPRQQTLRAAMEWSYELLSEPERLLLQRLSIFAGSFTLEAVEAVCSGQGTGARAEGSGTAPAPLPELTPDVLDLLSQLVDRSLVVVEAAVSGGGCSEFGSAVSPTRPPTADTQTRYHLLETVRQYARVRLQAGPPEGGETEEERVRRRHMEFYLRLAEEAGPQLWGQDQAAWMERLETEMDNMRAALDWALGTAAASEASGAARAAPGAEQALRLATALVGFWIQVRYPEEGRQRLAAALEGAGPARHSPEGAQALIDLGNLSVVRDDGPAAHAFFEESLAVWRELGDPRGIASGLMGLGQVARRRGEYVEARTRHEESLAIRRTLADRHGTAQSLIGLAATLQEQGEAPSAWAGYYEEALAIHRELGDQPGVATALGELANVAWRQGDYAQARQHREESLALWRAIGSRIGVIHSLGALGHLARAQGEYEDARAFYTESLHLRWELGDRYTLIQALEDFAELAAAEGEWARLTRLLGAAEALRAGMGHPLSARERGEYDRLLRSARQALGEAAVAAIQAEGRALTLPEAVAFALEAPHGEAPAAAEASPRPDL